MLIANIRKCGLAVITKRHHAPSKHGGYLHTSLVFRGVFLFFECGVFQFLKRGARVRNRGRPFENLLERFVAACADTFQLVEPVLPQIFFGGVVLFFGHGG